MHIPVEYAYLYKDGKSECFRAHEVEAKMAEGWSDNPNAKTAPQSEPTVEDIESAEPSEPVKRKRRTKEEIEAAKAAANPCQPEPS